MATDIPPEAIGFLSAVGVFIVALAVLFLFINRKLCFARVGGLPCLEEHGRRRGRGHQGARQGLVNSYGEDDDDDALSSSESDDEVLKQFEISVSRSQSFRAASGVSGGGVSVGGVSVSGEHPKPQLGLGRRHKFSRLSDQEEGSTEPSDCEEPAAQSERSFQDPLSAAAAAEDDDGASAAAASSLEDSAPHRESSPAPSGSMRRAAADGSEDKAAREHEQVTDSSSNWSPEDLPPPEEEEAPPPPPSTSSPRTPVSKCGDLALSLEFRAEAAKLLVSVASARDLPDKARSGMDAWQVHLVLLPAKKQRHKTSVQKGPAPRFHQTFRFSRLEPTELHAAALRVRLYALGGRMSREKMMGEKVLRLGGLFAQGPIVETTLLLEPRSNLKSVDSVLSLSAVSQSDSASSTQSLTHGGVPELLLGLTYNATTGRMAVELIKGSHFRNMAVNRPPDTFGRLSLLNSVGQEISRCKTSVRRSQPNPVYKETFVFQVALFQLSDVTLLVSVFGRRSMKRKEMVGWLSLGQNCSGPEEQLHWQDMKEARGQQVCRWHVLLEA